MKYSTLFLSSLLGWSNGAAALHGGKQHGTLGIERPRFGVGGSRADQTLSRLHARAPTATDGATRPSSMVACRGGECSDSDPALFAKVALGAAVETGLMYALVSFAAKANDLGYSKVVTRSLQVVALLVIIFGSASFGSLVDMGLSAATKQVLDPNQIPGNADWYANLKKPSWNPPGWLFPIMWLIVSKPTQFMAVWKLITQHSEKNLAVPLLAYTAHLSLGDAWNKVFFGLECPGRGLAVISAFYGVLLLSAYLFYQVDQYAGLLLLPTCGWVTVASALNLSIYNLNKPACED